MYTLYYMCTCLWLHTHIHTTHTYINIVTQTHTCTHTHNFCCACTQLNVYYMCRLLLLLLTWSHHDQNSVHSRVRRMMVRRRGGLERHYGLLRGDASGSQASPDSDPISEILSHLSGTCPKCCVCLSDCLLLQLVVEAVEDWLQKSRHTFSIF